MKYKLMANPFVTGRYSPLRVGEDYVILTEYFNPPKTDEGVYYVDRHVNSSLMGSLQNSYGFPGDTWLARWLYSTFMYHQADEVNSRLMPVTYDYSAVSDGIRPALAFLVVKESMTEAELEVEPQDLFEVMRGVNGVASIGQNLLAVKAQPGFFLIVRTRTFEDCEEIEFVRMLDLKSLSEAVKTMVVDPEAPLPVVEPAPAAAPVTKRKRGGGRKPRAKVVPEQPPVEQPVTDDPPAIDDPVLTATRAFVEGEEF